MWELDYKESWAPNIDAFELWCWRRLLRVPWASRRCNLWILKEISPEYSLEGLMLKLKLQYFGHLMQRADSLEKNPDAGKDRGQEEKGTTEDKMVGWHHWLDGHESEQAPGDGDGQRSLACCSPWCCKELDTTEWLNNKMLSQRFQFHIKYISLLYYNCRVKWAYQTSKTNNHTSSKGHMQYQHQ